MYSLTRYLCVLIMFIIIIKCVGKLKVFAEFVKLLFLIVNINSIVTIN